VWLYNKYVAPFHIEYLMPRSAKTPRTTASPAAATRARPRGGRALEIRNILQAEIESGELPPGAALDERALAERFGVSRTPVREALQQLAALDLVRIAPRHGVSVARFSITRMRSMLEFIGELEAICAKLATRRIDSAGITRLKASLAACKEAADRADSRAYAEANRELHDVIYQASRNPYLTDHLRAARRMVQRYHTRYFHTQAQMRKSYNDHVAVVEAILKGDEAEAYHAMLRHVPAGTTEFSEFLATVPLEFFEAEPVE